MTGDRHFVIGIGELLWDVFADNRRMGGAPVNFAYYASQCGCASGAVSAVGSDASGDALLAEFSALGLCGSSVQRNAFPTGTVEVSLDSAGVPQYDIRRNVAWDNIVFDKRLAATAPQTDAVCWGTLAQRSEVSRGAILEFVDSVPASALKIFDINLRQNFYDARIIADSLERADILKLNEDELPVVAEMFGMGGGDEAVLHALSKRFSLEYAVYTMGAKGSAIARGGEVVSYIDTPETEVADTVGAGDSFTATFTAMLLRGADARTAHEKAVKVAAFVCGNEGAINRLPDGFLR